MPKDVAGVLHEFKHGKLHSGSSKGPVVKSRKQAIAIALSEQRQKMKTQGKDKKAKVKKGKGGKGRFTPFVKNASSQADALDAS